jgi:hypothetical protein
MRLPIISVGSVEGPETNAAFQFLMLSNKCWQIIVRQLIEEATGIVVAVPGDRHWEGFVKSLSVQSAREEVARISDPGANLAKEISWILEQKSTRDKTLIVREYEDNRESMGPNHWVMLKDFRVIETDEVSQTIAGWCSFNNP